MKKRKTFKDALAVFIVYEIGAFIVGLAFFLLGLSTSFSDGLVLFALGFGGANGFMFIVGLIGVPFGSSTRFITIKFRSRWGAALILSWGILGFGMMVSVMPFVEAMNSQG